MTPALGPSFLAALDEPARGALAGWAGLEDALWALVAAGRGAWPAIAVDPVRFAAYLAERLPEAAPEAAPADVLARLDAAELWLTCACGLGDGAALTAFEAGYLVEVPGALARMRLGQAVDEEVRQLVRHKLFVAEPGSRPRIDDYAGRGDLRGLVRVAAVRTALDLLRRHKHERPPDDDEILRLAAPEDDPELQYIKERHRAEFGAAFEAAVAVLSSRERNLLRLHLVNGVTLDQIGTFYAVHRATVVRWLARARERLAAETRRLLRERLHVSPEEFDSIVRLVQSRLDVSIHRILRSQD